MELSFVLPGPAVLATLRDACLNTARSGIAGPMRLDRSLRQLDAVRRWGTTLPGALAAAAAIAPGTPAVVDDAGTQTYAELSERVHRLAAALADLGVSELDRVGVLCRNHAGLVTTVLALATLGADAVLLNTGAGPEQLAKVLVAQRVRLLVADAEFGPPPAGAPDGIRHVTAGGTAPEAGPSLDTLIGGVRPGRRLAPPARVGRLIVLTSGTTGTPKGAARPEPTTLTAAASLTGLLAKVPLRAGAATLIPAPLFHTWGLAALQLCLATRATMVLSRHFDAAATLALAAEHRARQMFAVPVMLTRILELPADVRAGHDLSALKVVVSSGSAIPAATVTGFLDAFGDVLYNLYGSTEVSWASIATPKDLRAHPGTAGRPPLGTRLAIVDPAGADVLYHATGRIFVGNPLLFTGYTDGSSREVRDGMMSTGDLGHVDADGYLYVDGRADDMVVSGGENVFPREVEDVLSALPGVREAAVVGVPDEAWGQRLAAFVVLAPGASLDADGVREAVRAALARHCVPRDVTFLDELPRNATGKVLGRLLRGPGEPVSTAPAGYSGKSVPDKLGVKPGSRVLLAGAPDGFALEPLPAEVALHTRAGPAPYDVVLAFCPDRATLERRFAPLIPRLTTPGALWVAWPKKASGLARDLDENVVREVGLAAGLVDVKVIAIDAIWSGLKFVRRLKDR